MPLLDVPPDEAEALIRAEAARLGFSRLRFASLDPEPPGVASYDDYVAKGFFAEMGWLATGREPRSNPRSILPSARSAVVLGVDYDFARRPDPGGLTGKVACYAWGRDYHNLVGRKVKKLCKTLRAAGIQTYGSVDDRPLLERAWAERAGIGFIGKNCLVITPGRGSTFFLAVILVSAALPPDLPRATATKHCGACTRCLVACPTQAFAAAGQLDARRCVSYLTIENQGPIPLELRRGLGRWLFGCDDCQEVCPHNHRPPPPEFADLAPRPGHDWVELDALLFEADEALEARLEGSPIRRPGAVGLKRNAAVVLGNLGDRAARPALLHALDHPHPLVAEHARWALDQIG
jgi:epoxyqueuosine reductase